MSPRPALITKRDAETVFAAAAANGYDSARVIAHPDGRVEIVVQRAAARRASAIETEWDEVLGDDAQG